MQLNEIDKIVMDRYPTTAKERSCAYEKMRLNALRAALRKRLLEQQANDKTGVYRPQ